MDDGSLDVTQAVRTIKCVHAVIENGYRDTRNESIPGVRLLREYEGRVLQVRERPDISNTSKSITRRKPANKHPIAGIPVISWRSNDIQSLCNKILVVAVLLTGECKYIIVKPVPSDKENEALFRRMSEGDEVSFTTLFHSYTPKLYNYLLQLTKNDHIARDLVQETFLKLWVNREFLHGVANPLSYLFRIAANLSINYLRQENNRRRIRESLPVYDDNHEATEEVITARVVSGMIAKAVAGLPEKRREIYRMSREQGMSHEQIATSLGLSVQTVKNQLGTALKALQQALSQETGLSVAVVALLLSL